MHSRGCTRHRKSGSEQFAVSALKKLFSREERRPVTAKLLICDILIFRIISFNPRVVITSPFNVGKLSCAFPGEDESLSFMAIVPASGIGSG